MKDVAEEIIEVLKPLIEAMVRYPKDLRFEAKELRNSVIIDIHCNRFDFGKLMGRGGKMIKSIEIVASLIAKKAESAIKISLIEANTQSLANGVMPAWDKQKIERLARETANRLFDAGTQVMIGHGGSASVIEIVIDGDEEIVPSEILKGALGVMFYAIGKNHGERAVYLELIRKGSGAISQPVANRGRFCA